MDLFDLAIAGKLSGGGGGGGASNIVFGGFTADTAGVHDYSVPYSGNGYPVTMVIWPEDGFTEQVTDSIYEVCFYGAVKESKYVAPDYTGVSSAKPNRAYVATTHRRSGSAMGGSTQTAYPYSTDGAKATASNTQLAIFKNKNTLSIYAQESTSYYGFSVGAKYRYMIEYSE